MHLSLIHSATKREEVEVWQYNTPPFKFCLPSAPHCPAYILAKIFFVFLCTAPSLLCKCSAGQREHPFSPAMPKAVNATGWHQCSFQFSSIVVPLHYIEEMELFDHMTTQQKKVFSFCYLSLWRATGVVAFKRWDIVQTKPCVRFTFLNLGLHGAKDSSPHPRISCQSSFTNIVI